jgi:hypothetical protein
MALAKNDVYARIELEQVTVQNVNPCLLFIDCVNCLLLSITYLYALALSKSCNFSNFRFDKGYST